MEALKLGEPAPAFEAKDTAGVKYSFVPTGPGAKMLVFWSIFCEPCREEMPVIQRIADEYKAAGTLDVLAVNMDGEPFVDGSKALPVQVTRVLLDELDEKGDLRDRRPLPGRRDPVLYL
jgi:thiol-disulfide isomerase/thioredoxin